jgi:hypothetical protein
MILPPAAARIPPVMPGWCGFAAVVFVQPQSHRARIPFPALR